MEVGFLSITVATELVDHQVESNKENAAVPPCPLPANTYTSAHLYQETKHAPIPGFLGNNDNINLKNSFSARVSVHTRGLRAPRKCRGKCDEAFVKKKTGARTGD